MKIAMRTAGACCLLGTLSLLPLGGCAAGPGTQAPESLWGTPDGGAWPATTPEASIEPRAVALRVDPPSRTTVCTESVALRGAATPGAEVYAQGGRATSDIATAHPTDGSFCIDVPLVKDHVNALEVWAKHPTDGLSEPRRISITQDTLACGDAPAAQGAEPSEPELYNVAQGATVSSKDTPDKNPAVHVTDGDPDTWCQWKGGDWWNPWDPYDGWVKVSLDEVVLAQRIVVRWRDERDVSEHSDWGKKYRLLYAVSDGLGDPHPNVWLTVPQGVVQDGDGGTDTFELHGMSLKHVVLWLEHNGHESWEEAFAIAELEVLVDPGLGATPAPQISHNSCAAGGTP